MKPKELIIYLIAATGQLAAIVLMFLALFIEPSGEIHSSALSFYGITCGFTSLLFGVSAHYSSELNSFKEKITDSINRKIEGLEKPD